MGLPVGVWVHLTGDTTAQTNVPGAPPGVTLVKVVVNTKATAATTMTLKDGTTVIAVLDLTMAPGSVVDYSVQVAGQLSRTFSTTTSGFDLTLVIA